MLKQRVITALILGVLILLAIFFLPVPIWSVLVAGIVCLAVWEWGALMSLPAKGRYGMMPFAALPGVFIGFHSPHGDGLMILLCVYLCSIFFWLFTASSWLRIKPDFRGGSMAYLIGMTLFVPTSLAMVELKRAHPGLLVLAILGVCVADIAAFFVGRAFGKRKLAPSISPGKSWEGFYGGVSGVVIFFLVCAAWVVPAVMGRFGFFGVLVFALVYALASVEGDLFESLIKRTAGVKDSGTLLPGHGGVLDRIDSMLSTLPLAGAVLAAWQYF